MQQRLRPTPRRPLEADTHEAIADRQFFVGSPSVHLKHEAMIAGLARLDAPPRPNKRLLKSMQTPAPWE